MTCVSAERHPPARSDELATPFEQPHLASRTADTTTACRSEFFHTTAFTSFGR